MKNYLQPAHYITKEQFLADIDKPGILMRMKMLAPDDRRHFEQSVAQFQRAENGERYVPMPFAATDQHRPDRVADPELMARNRRQVQRIEQEQAAAMLAERMGTDADRPLPPVTLRDQIAAAYSVHSQE